MRALLQVTSIKVASVDTSFQDIVFGCKFAGELDPLEASNLEWWQRLR